MLVSNGNIETCQKGSSTVRLKYEWDIVKIRENKLKKTKSIGEEGINEIWEREIVFIINGFEKDIKSLVRIVILYILF